jgi:(S)-mandelate dehydrogenase
VALSARPRRIARRLPKIAFDVIEGGLEDERGLERNTAACHKHRRHAGRLEARAQHPQRFCQCPRRFFQALSLKPSILAEALIHPGWIVEYLRRGGGTPMFENWQPHAPAGSDAEAVNKHSSSLRPFNAQTWRDLENYRRLFPRNLIVKGIMYPGDALRAAEIGGDGVIVSNHGGRPLDQAPASLDVLPAIKAAVGDKMMVMLDSGVRRGADILIALCLGAQFCFMGRPTLYGAAAGGLADVKKAISILRDEIDLVMGQIGCPSLDQLGPDFLWREDWPRNV